MSTMAIGGDEEGGICQYDEVIFVGWIAQQDGVPTTKQGSIAVCDTDVCLKSLQATKKWLQITIFVAEKEGFEPSRQSPVLHP